MLGVWISLVKPYMIFYSNKCSLLLLTAIFNFLIKLLLWFSACTQTHCILLMNFIMLCRVSKDYMLKDTMLLMIPKQQFYQWCAKYVAITKWIVFVYHVVMRRLVRAVQQGCSILVSHVTSVTKQWPLFIQYTYNVTL